MLKQAPRLLATVATGSLSFYYFLFNPITDEDH